jgi:hypothetical protein
MGNINVLLNGQDERGYVKNILESYNYILSSIAKLNEEGIIFYDFGNDKMKFDKKGTNHGILCGFEKSILAEDLRNENKEELLEDMRRYIMSVSVEENSLKPFEINILREVVQMNRNKEMGCEECDKIKRKYMEGQYVIWGCDRELEEESEKCKEIIGGIVGKRRNEIIRILLCGYETWDNNSVSKFYMYIIRNMEGEDKETKELIKGMKKIMRRNISCKMSERNTIKETQRELKELMEKI